MTAAPSCDAIPLLECRLADSSTATFAAPPMREERPTRAIAACFRTDANGVRSREVVRLGGDPITNADGAVVQVSRSRVTFTAARERRSAPPTPGARYDRDDCALPIVLDSLVRMMRAVATDVLHRVAAPLRNEDRPAWRGAEPACDYFRVSTADDLSGTGSCGRPCTAATRHRHRLDTDPSGGVSRAVRPFGCARAVHPILAERTVLVAFAMYFTERTPRRDDELRLSRTAATARALAMSSSAPTRHAPQ